MTLNNRVQPATNFQRRLKNTGFLFTFHFPTACVQVKGCTGVDTKCLFPGNSLTLSTIKMLYKKIPFLPNYRRSHCADMGWARIGIRRLCARRARG
jgi:hypothetical protein